MPETFDDFRALTVEEVRHRAEIAETLTGSGAVEGTADRRLDRAWRWLYREMRRARATTVGDLKVKVVERYAYRLGYGYFRVRYGRRDAFMPFGGR